MKSTELRLGNFIQNKVNKEIEVVTRVGTTNLVSTDRNDGGPDYYWEGIPITEEWLFKFGFHQLYFVDLKTDSYRKDSIFLNKVGGDHSIYQLSIGNTMFQVFPKHIHRLQNIYHAIEEKELILNPQI